MVLCHACDIIPLLVIHFVPRDRELKEEEIPLKDEEVDIPLDDISLEETNDAVKVNI